MIARAGLRRLPWCAALVALLLLPAPARAQQTPPGLSISAPSAVDLGSHGAGSRTITGSLGSVTVSTSARPLGGLGSWTAVVSTSGFVTGSSAQSSDTSTVTIGSPAPAQVVPPASVSYRSGTASGLAPALLAVCAPGQPLTAVSLSTPQTAYACTGFSLLTATSVTWNPEISITISPENVVGAYTGSITHSVA